MNSGAAPEHWEGNTETGVDTATLTPVRALAALLDRECEQRVGDELRLPEHWLYFLPTARQSDLGEDGHPRRGGFLPDVPLPHRMWAGSRIEYHSPLHLGAEITRTSRIAAVNSKQGRSGALVFVRVVHQISSRATLAITEEQDIVYRDARQSSAARDSTPAPDDAVWMREIVPDPVLLFRFSALTFNAHRIHYDRAYATEREHYPGLVVHGPLVATLLLDLVHRSLPGVTVRRFSFRAVSPLFDLARFFVCGKPDPDEPQSLRLWAQSETGALAMEAQAWVDSHPFSKAVKTAP